MLAERFGGSPFAYWQADARERERLLEMLTVEAEVAHAYAGLGPGDEVVYVDDED
jgi:hypothetical protein